MPVVELAQGQVHHRDEGDGPAVVLLHLVLANGRVWDHVVPRLTARGLRVIVPDLPFGGHRTPMRADADLSVPGIARLVAELLERLNLRDVTLVGNDTGGAITQVVATRHPERLGRFVLTSCDLEEDFPPRVVRPVVRLALAPGALAVTGRLMASARVRALFMRPFARAPHDEITASWFAPLRADAAIRRDVRKVLAGIDARHTVQAARELRTTALPSLWAWGERDLVFRPERARRLAATVPGARFLTIPGARTLTPLDAPDVLAGLVADFARQRQGPAEAGPETIATSSAD